MSQSKSPTLLQVLLDWIQKPTVWVPGFAALLALVFITEWVVHPEPEITATNTIVNEEARTKLTPEQSALASEIDDLDVLLKQLDNEANAELLKKPQKKAEPDSTTTVDLPTFKINAPVLGVPGEARAPGETNFERSSVLRNFFSSRNGATEETGTASDPVSAAVVSASDNGTLSLSLQQPAAAPLFGTPQSIGLPTVLPPSGSNRPVSSDRTLTAPVPAASAPYLTTPNTTGYGSYPYPSSGTVGNPGTPPGSAYYSPTYNPATAPYAGGSGVSGSGVPGVSTGNLPNNLPSGSVVPVSPYALDSSFSNPLAPPAIPAPDSRLAPGQYAGNGEINTFANP